AGEAAPVHALVVVAIRAALHRLPPGPMVTVPGHRVGETFLDRAARPPAGGAQAAGVERVAAIVPRTIRDVAHQLRGPAGERQDLVGDVPVRQRALGAHVVDRPVGGGELEYV